MKRIGLAVFIVTAALLFVACGRPREVLSAEEFTSRMENAGHTVEDITYSTEIPGVEALLVANLGEFTVEFIVRDTVENAGAQYNSIKRDLEDRRGRTRSYRQVSISNFSRFIQTTEGRFEALVRVENTLALILTTTENRNAAEAALELLGY